MLHLIHTARKCQLSQWYNPLFVDDQSNPYLSRTATIRSRSIRAMRKNRSRADLRSLKIRNTSRCSSRRTSSGVIGPRCGYAPLQRSRRSARPSLVPSVSTTTFPYQLGSITQAPVGEGPGPAVLGIGNRTDMVPGAGRMVKEERFTQRTTVCLPP